MPATLKVCGASDATALFMPPVSEKNSSRKFAEQAVLPTFTLLHRGPESCPGPLTMPCVLPANCVFQRWACLDSNQGPLPYQGSKGISGASCPVRESGLSIPILLFLTLPFSCSVQLCSSWVAARLLHTERARQDSTLRPAD